MYTKLETQHHLIHPAAMVTSKGMHSRAACVLYLAVENDVLASAQNRLAANFVPRCLNVNRNLEWKSWDFWAIISIKKARTAETITINGVQSKTGWGLSVVLHPYCPSSGREDYEFGVRRVDCKVRLHHKNKLGKAESRKGREGWGITQC